MSLLEAKIESLIFCSPKPIKVSDIIKAFSESENKNFTEEEINNSINNLNIQIDIRDYPAGVYQLKLITSSYDVNRLILVN